MFSSHPTQDFMAAANDRDRMRRITLLKTNILEPFVCAARRASNVASPHDLTAAAKDLLRMRRRAAWTVRRLSSRCCADARCSCVWDFNVRNPAAISRYSNCLMVAATIDAPEDRAFCACQACSHPTTHCRNAADSARFEIRRAVLAISVAAVFRSSCAETSRRWTSHHVVHPFASCRLSSRRSARVSILMDVCALLQRCNSCRHVTTAVYNWRCQIRLAMRRSRSA